MNSTTLTTTGNYLAVSGNMCNTLGSSLGQSLTLNPNSTNYYNTYNQMRQVKAVLLKVVKDPDTNAIIDSTVEKEFWVKQKSDVSFELAAMVELGRVIDPETEVIKEVYSLYL